ncbi:MAG TPA: arginase family protein [Longimicrobiaceae bacterium]|nr:arginase family protein [Longimicrobiaceae bacterium]
MEVRILAVPWDSGRRAWRMGRGPERLLEAGLEDALRARGHAARVEWVEADDTGAEVATAFRLARTLADRVREAAGEGAFPLALAGNCSAALGVLGGVGPAGVVWLDAHADLNTPETTRSGMVDGMSLAMATGRCWTGIAGTIRGFLPVPDDFVVLAGARDLEPGERAVLARSALATVDATRVREEGVEAAFGPALEALAQRVRRVYLHLDLDVLDPSAARANGFAAPGGLTPEEAEAAVRLVGRRLEVAGATLSAYDPDADPEGRVPAAAARLAAAAVEGAGARPRPV